MKASQYFGLIGAIWMAAGVIIEHVDHSPDISRQTVGGLVSLILAVWCSFLENKETKE